MYFFFILKIFLITKIKFLNMSKFYFEKYFTPTEENLDLNNFFYPLDKIKNWNKIYGHKGFIQYQFVIPYKLAGITISNILNILKKIILIHI